jgi:hypothetical protein
MADLAGRINRRTRAEVLGVSVAAEPGDTAEAVMGRLRAAIPTPCASFVRDYKSPHAIPLSLSKDGRHVEALVDMLVEADRYIQDTDNHRLAAAMLTALVSHVRANEDETTPAELAHLADVAGKILVAEGMEGS